MKRSGSRGQMAQGLSGHLPQDSAGSQAGAVGGELESHALPGCLSSRASRCQTPIFSRDAINPDFSQKSLHVTMSATNQNQINKASKACRLKPAQRSPVWDLFSKR